MIFLKVCSIILTVREKLFGMDGIYYINGSQTLPPPLKKTEEQIVMEKITNGDNSASVIANED